MVIIRSAEAKWTGDLKTGDGVIRLGSGVFEGPYSFKDRTTQESTVTNPEELIGAAHAGCFSMALSGVLTQAGFPPQQIQTQARVHLDKNEAGISISQIDLETEVKVDGLSEVEFLTFAETAKRNCPVSKALAAVKITLMARLV